MIKNISNLGDAALYCDFGKKINKKINSKVIILNKLDNRISDIDFVIMSTPMSQYEKIIPYLNNKATISLLWDICRIPDFQKFSTDSYIDFLKNIFL